MKNLLCAGRGRADRPKKRCHNNNKQMREKMRGSNHRSVVVVVGRRKNKKKRKKKRKRNIRKFYSRVVDRAGLANYSTAGLVTMGTMVL